MSRLTETLEADLTKLEAEGIKLDLEKLIWLNDLARIVENPQGRVAAATAGSPIEAGGFYFWTLTLQSSLWFRDVACRYFTTEKMMHCALGFASAFGRDEHLPSWAAADTFEKLNTEPSARKTVKRFARRFRGNKKELESALFRLMPDLDAPYPLPQKESPDLDDDSILADLLAGTGLSREYWQRQHAPFVLRTLAAMCKQAAAGASEDPEQDPEYIAAFIEYDKALKVCKDDYLKERDDGTE
jgi:hypothetical protein